MLLTPGKGFELLLEGRVATLRALGPVPADRGEPAWWGSWVERVVATDALAALAPAWAARPWAWSSNAGEGLACIALGPADLARLAERSEAREPPATRDFVGFASPLRVEGEEEAGFSVPEVRAVAACFPAELQHLNLEGEATVDRLAAVGGRPLASRVLHLVAGAEPAAGGARLSLRNAAGERVLLGPGDLEGPGPNPLPRAELVVLSLFTGSGSALRSGVDWIPWVEVLRARGARSVLIGARAVEDDARARRELGFFYDGLARGEEVARAWKDALLRSREDPPSAPVFHLFGDPSFRAGVLSPPDLTILAPDEARRPWWAYIVIALLLPTLVFLLFRSLSTNR